MVPHTLVLLLLPHAMVPSPPSMPLPTAYGMVPDAMIPDAMVPHDTVTTTGK